MRIRSTVTVKACVNKQLELYQCLTDVNVIVLEKKNYLNLISALTFEKTSNF